jgi:hypothetical protein
MNMTQFQVGVSRIGEDYIGSEYEPDTYVNNQTNDSITDEIGITTTTTTYTRTYIHTNTNVTMVNE